MYLRCLVAAAVYQLAAGQSAPTRVNVTATDGAINLEWAILTPGGEANLASFEVMAKPATIGVPVPSPLYVVQDDFNSLSYAVGNWKGDVGPCIDTSMTQGTYCINGAMKAPETFSVSNGLLNIKSTGYHSLSYSWSYPSTSNEYDRNGVPVLMRDWLPANNSLVFMTEVINPDIQSNAYGGWPNGGMMIYDRVGGVVRPLIMYWYEVYQTDYSWNEIAVRWYDNTGYHQIRYTNVYPGRGPVGLAIHRDATAGEWRFSYKHSVLSANAWTGQSFSLKDSGMVYLTASGLTNARSGLYCHSDYMGNNNTWSFDYFNVATLSSWEAYLNAVVANSAPNRTAALVPKGYCAIEREVKQSGLYYTRSKAYYKHTIYGLQNGVNYLVTVSSVSTTGTRITYSAASQYMPKPVLPRLGASSSGSQAALFLDSASLFPAGQVYRWRDASGNGRDFIQFNTARQPTSSTTGVKFPNNFAELVQENSDTGLDLANAAGGLTWFTAYRLASDGYYWQHQALLSRITLNPSNVQYTWTPDVSSDDAGWDIFAFQTGYSPPWTYIHRVGMRIVSGRKSNPVSSDTTPNVAGIGAHWQWGPQYTLTTHLDATSPALYSYNYYKMPGGYPVGSDMYAQNRWILEACRGINFGATTDLCNIPDLVNNIPQATTNAIKWIPGFLYLGGSPMWPNPADQQTQATGRWYDPWQTDDSGNMNQASRATKMRLSDATDYNYYYGRRYFYGTVYGIMIYKNAIFDRSDRALVQGWMGERYGLACRVSQYDYVDTTPNPGMCAPDSYVSSGSSCTASCNTGRRVIGGARAGEGFMCMGGSFLSKGPVCGAQCPTVTMPVNAANCTLRYARDDFNVTPGRLLRTLVKYDVYPPTKAAISDQLWTFDGSVVRGNAPSYVDECSDFSVKPTILMLNRPLWGDVSYSKVDPMQYQVKMVLEQTGSEAGIAFRVAATYVTGTSPSVSVQYYRMVLTAGKAGARLEHVSGTTDATTGVPKLVIRSLGNPLVPSFMPLPFTDYVLTVITRGTAIKAFVNGVLLFDLPDTAIPHGGMGMYLGFGAASFDDLEVAGPCAVSGNCQANEGGACIYACPEGFTGVGDAAQVCAANMFGTGVYTGTPFQCKPTPPSPDNANPQFTMFEDADVDTVVGALNVTAGGPNQVLIFSIVAGNNVTNNDAQGRPIPDSFSYDIFDIGTCSGVITLGTAGVISYDRGHRSIWMMVRAAVASDPDVYTDFPVRVTILNARSPPYFVDQNGDKARDITRIVDENRPVGYPIGLPVSAVVPEAGQVIAYDILYGNSGGEFAISNATGQLYVAKAVFNYEGPKATPSTPNEYFLIVRARDIVYPKLQATVNLKLTVGDADDAPAVATQDFQIIEDALSVPGTSIGKIIAKDEDEIDTLAYTQTNMPPEFYLNATTGELSLRSSINLGPIDDRPFQIIDGRAVRRVYRFTGRVSDAKSVTLSTGEISGPLTTSFPVNVYVLVNNSYGGNPIVTAALVLKTTPPGATSQVLDTAGGETLLISGRDFQSVVTMTGSSTVYVNLTASAGPGSPARSYPMSGCAIQNDNEIKCTSTAAGYGKNLALVVAWGTTVLKVMVYDGSGSPILMSYAPPVVRGVAIEPRAGIVNPPSVLAFSTEGTHAFAVQVSNTGPANAPITVTYGGPYGRDYTAGYYLTRPSSRYGVGQLVAYVVPGIGANLLVRVIVGNQESDVDATVIIGYARPTITSIAPQTPDFTIGTLRTLQLSTSPQVIEITGTNFGRSIDTLFVQMIATRSMPVQGVTTPVTLEMQPTCRKPNALTEHTFFTCNVPSGFGKSYKMIVTVGNQTSVLPGTSTLDLAYVLPNVTAVSGLGARNADTSGGQEVILTGSNFGPSSLVSVNGQAPVANPLSVTYGPTGVEYTARNCRVMDSNPDRQISCQLAPGSGAGHKWRVTVAGQDPTSQPSFTTSYGAPVVIGLSKDSAVPNNNRGYKTVGGEMVYISGKNFGPFATIAAGRFSVFYVLTLDQTTNALNVSLGAAADGTIRYIPTDCIMTIEHFEMACKTVQGAGTDLSWTMIIDGLNSTQPLLGYRRPVITAIDLYTGGATGLADAISTDGGETLRITGMNFGPATYNNSLCTAVTDWADGNNQICTGLVQALSYGPTGTELEMDTITVISDTEIRVKTKAGYGGPHRFVLTVGDQISPQSDVTFSYAKPVITSIEPSSGVPTAPGLNAFAVVVKGNNFGLNDPQAEVSIMVGNPGDNSVGPLIPTFNAGPDGSGHMVSFFLPNGLLPDRAVRVVLHPRGSPMSALRVVSEPINAAAFLSYIAPNVENVVVSAVPTDNAVVNWLLTRGGVTTDDLKTMVQLVVIGTNFGVDAGTTGDSIFRTVDFVPSTDGNALVYQWTDSRIVAFTKATAGTIHTMHKGKTWGGADAYAYSNDRYFNDFSPAIRNIDGNGVTQFRTQGGEMVTLTVGYLSSAVTNIGVVVGTNPAALFTVNDVPINNFADFQTGVIIPGRATAPNDPGAMNFTFKVQIPAGQGTRVPVIVIRDDTEKSDVLTTIDYKPPSIASYQVYDEFATPAAWGAVVTYAPGATITVPTLGTRVRLLGDNFGLCPTIKMGLGATAVLLGAGGSSVCAATAVAPPAGEPANTHQRLTFEAAPGQGTGPAPNGFTLEVTVGGQTSIDANLIKFRYLAPVINTVSSNSGTTNILPGGRTAGGNTIYIRGYNLGYAVARGLNVVIGPSNCTSLTITIPSPRTAEQVVTCKLAVGSGGPHDVVLTQVLSGCISNCAATKPGFTYFKPVVTGVYFNGTGWASGSYQAELALGRLNATANPPYGSAAIYADRLPELARYGTELLAATRNGQDGPVRMPAAGGYIVTLTGDNFGKFTYGSHCLMVPWGGRDRGTGAGHELACDGQISMLGENEVPAFAILYWSHTRITFIMPPGYGGREFVPKIAGQEPVWPVAVHYEDPKITAELNPSRGGTKGGDAITITGRGFGSAPVNTAIEDNRRRVTSGPIASDLATYLTAAPAPQAIMKVNFFRKCATNHKDGLGNLPSRVELCVYPVTGHTDGEIKFGSLPGIGVNRTVTVEILDFNSTAGFWFNYTSNEVKFSYNPPKVRSVQPPIIRMAPPSVDGTLQDGVSTITLSGINFGDQPPALLANGQPNPEAWLPEEAAVTVSVASVSCRGPARKVVGVATTVIDCALTDQVVGYKNITYTVAGQTNTNAEAEGDFRVPFMVCDSDYFGKPGEKCLECPYGANCDGFVQNRTGAAGSGLSLSLDGVHTYPRPREGFYNMNSSDQLNGGMLGQCPDLARIDGRDVCIVSCEPADACAGDNYCSEAYISKAPYYRCSNCAPGFYRRANECVKCPNSPWALVIGFCALVLFAALAGYVLNKKKINIAFIAIGVDWAQVIAIFAASKVAWPPVVKELFNILSAFNLNIEIVAPECIVPDLQYKQKWSFIMALPIGLTVFFMLITAGQVLFRKFIKGRKVSLANQGVSFVSMVLLLMYVLYIYLTRNILDIFNCQPTEPSDGRYYLAAVFEECGIAGGTQMTLMGSAVAAAFFYIALYPVGVFSLLWRNREKAMEDQLLRAKGVGNDKLSNPRAYFLRKNFSRVYYQFKPDHVFWVLAILLRKFCLAATYILFSRNASFQLAAALLVIFVAYAAQMKYSPYMGPGDYDDVLRANEIRALNGDALSAKLHDRLRNVESRGRKKVHKNLMSASGKIDAGALLGLLRGWLFAYNTVEEILLFSAGTVALMGIMYASLSTSSGSYQDARDSVTWVIVGAIILTIIYFFTVVFTEVYMLYTEDQRRKLAERRAKSKGKGKLGAEDDEVATKNREAAAAAASNAEVSIGAVSSSYNPMFEGKSSTAGLREVVAATDDVPSMDLWRVFRQGYQELQDDLNKLSKEAADLKAAHQKMEAAAALLERTTGQKITVPEITDANGEKFRAGKRKQEFGPVGSDSPAMSGVSPLARSMSARSPGLKSAGSAKSLRSLGSPVMSPRS